MYNINTYNPLTDPWYNLGQMIGWGLGKQYKNLNMREAKKQGQYQDSREKASQQDKTNQAFQSAYNLYDTTKNDAYNDLKSSADAYNADPSQGNWDSMVAKAKKYDNSFDSSDTMGVTNTLNRIHSGEASYLQPYRASAMESAKTINPNVDFKSGDWGTNTYKMGLDTADYYRNFENSNKGKTFGGTGDKKYTEWVDYLKNSPNVTQQTGALNPNMFSQSAPTFGMPSTPTFGLPTATPLNTNYYDPNDLKQYVKG